MLDTYGSTTEYTIKEAAIFTGIPQTTLRDWERLFSIPIERNEFKQRKYTEKTLNIFKEIKKNKAKGLRIEDIKPFIGEDSQGHGSATKNFEIITEPFSEKEQNLNNYNLIIKPYENKIDGLNEEIKILIAEKATLAERVQGKDEIISFLQQQKQQLEARLSRKWWHFGI